MTPLAPDGLLLIDKPGGITSHDAVAAVRRALGTKKVGHAGTLDPMATGLLVMGVGRATRLLRFLGELPKTYEGSFRLGIRTTTLDAEGDMVEEGPVAVSQAAVAGAMSALVGDSHQTPPAFSAVKVAGTKLYEAARRGETLSAPPRLIHVESFDLLELEPPDATFRVVCGGGTYVRVLAADVGDALGCGAHLTRLRRTTIGSLTVEDATLPDDPGAPRPVSEAVAHLPRVRLEPEEAIAAGHGRVLAPTGFEGPYAVFSPAGNLVGVYEDDGAKARPLVILPPAQV